MERRFAGARLPHYVSSFGLAVLCDAITLKRPASRCFEILDRLLAMGAPRVASSTDVSGRAKEFEAVVAG